MISTQTIHETVHYIKGPAGALALMVSDPILKGKSAWGIVCHPHPLYGGNMTNKVVTTLAKTFQNLGVQTVRFNFRGVGESEGKFDEGRGELDDLLSVVDWVLQINPEREIWLAGFSFGAGIALRAATTIPVTHLVAVAPPVAQASLRRLKPILCPWILVQGEKDQVVSPKAVFAWAKKRKPLPTIIRLPEAEHFFHGQLTVLRTQLEEMLRR